ncbi:cip1-interacting zinc finger protein [Ornithorhynchus anatinus]|uniref:CDKN1A interacting zinc finger protein 1 n=1 Tax=Ornithorhynchus anatinus TaxID=9258 RepID=A0A6I8N2I6_ORNAN|nr:cip1-interacting zinc finger protein [Ornithorhynchus anatinus]XP_028919217.1 cip1-interacting zinc finger protein [Ornithorhynchus anatinus]
MFNQQQQQQQQQQFQQQLLQLQHLLQQQQQQQPAGRGLSPQQQQQLLNLRVTNQASLLNANPIMQRALLMQQMQGNLRGFSLTAPGLQQFFPQATRHSLLGPPPVGVSLKPPCIGFPGLPFQRQNRLFRKDYQRGPDRKRDLEQSSSAQAPGGEEKLGAPGAPQVGADCNASPGDPQPPTDPMADGSSEPAAKRLKSSEGAEGDLEEPSLESEGGGKEGVDPTDLAKDRNFSEEAKAPEMVSSGGSLKVTIQQSSESRAISTSAGHRPCEGVPAAAPAPEAGLKFYCYICKANCYNQQNFQAHMAGLQHQQRLGEIQHMSNACLVSLLPSTQEQPGLGERDGEPQGQRWCNTCQLHFTGDLIKHRRTPEHKLAKHSLRPFCTACSRHFKTPRKFVEHMKSPEHKQKAKEVRLGEKELGGPEESEELITVDAVGCFEEDEEEEEGTGGEEEEDSDVLAESDEVAAGKQGGLKDVAMDDWKVTEEYCPDKSYGLDFLVPVVGYLCRLCQTFYHSDSAARLMHCKSLMHFENVQRYKAARKARPVPPATEADPTPSPPRVDETGAPSSERDKKAAAVPQPWESQRETGDSDSDPDDACGALVIAEEDGSPQESEPGGGLEEPDQQDKGDAPSPAGRRRSTRRKPR